MEAVLRFEWLWIGYKIAGAGMIFADVQNYAWVCQGLDEQAVQ
jgi:hypothetical protein